MFVLGINASSRKNGNCSFLLEEALKGAKERDFSTESIFLDALKISPWRENNPKDDMDNVVSKMINSDAVILASPIYFGSLSAQAKIMIDRCQFLWHKQNVLKEKIRKNKASATLILTQASDRTDFFDNAEHIARNFFVVIEAEYKKGLFCPGLEDKKDVFKHPEFLKNAYNLGKSLA